MKTTSKKGFFPRVGFLCGLVVLFNLITVKVKWSLISLLVKRINALGRKSGWLFTALYLKQASTCLMQYYAVQDPGLPQKLSVPVSLTRKGLPRIIPPFHQKWISNRDERADMLVKFYLSAFSLIKVIRHW